MIKPASNGASNKLRNATDVDVMSQVNEPGASKSVVLQLDSASAMLVMLTESGKPIVIYPPTGISPDVVIANV